MPESVAFPRETSFCHEKQGCPCGAAVWWAVNLQSRAARLCATARMCGRASFSRGRTWITGGTEALLIAQRQSACPPTPQNVLVGQWHHTQLPAGGGGCLPCTKSYQGCSWIAGCLGATSLGFEFQPPLNISFCLSHLKRCRTALALFGPSWKPRMSYFLLHEFGIGMFSALSC